MKWYRIAHLVTLAAVALLMAQFTASPTTVQAAMPAPAHRPYHHGEIAPAGTGDEGFYLTYQNHIIGVQGMFSTGATWTPLRGTPAREVTYFFPVLPPGNSCLEMLTAAYYAGTTLWHAAGFFDSCNSRFQYTLIDIGAAFYQNKYQQTVTYPSPVNGVSVTDKLMTMQVIRTSPPPANCWVGQILNLQTSAWDTLVTACGTDDRAYTEGWAMFETYGVASPASSTSMCNQIGTYDNLTIRGLKFKWDNIPAPGYTPVYAADHASEFRDAVPCFSTSDWKYGSNLTFLGGDSWIVCGLYSIACDE